MRPLDNSQCRALLSVSAVLCAVPIVLMPLAARSSFDRAGHRPQLPVRLIDFAEHSAEHRTDPPIEIARDPFALPARAPDRDVTGMHVVQGESTGIRVPADAVRVTAVVEGAGARALVEVDGIVRVVTVGDSLHGAIVRGIDRRGIRLNTGAIIPVASASR